MYQKVTFIFHSSFAVELEKTILVFDYYGEGRLPEFPKEKQVYFFSSHRHPDHFHKKILDDRTSIGNPEYILSKDIHLRPEEKKPWIHVMKAQETCIFGNLKVRTLRSTDEGVAFIVETEGVKLYHAGDLNWWHWEEEGRAWNHNMAANYKREIGTIEGQHFDFAFVVLDPRLGSAYSLGMDYYLQHTWNEHVFPMHCWEKYEICSRYKEKLKKDLVLGAEKTQRAKNIHILEYPGQQWVF